MKAKEPSPEEIGRVVYNRDRSGGASQDSGDLPNGESQSLAPALTPLLIGSTVLLILVIGLGVISVVKLRSVSSSVLTLQRQHSDQLNFLLKLRSAITVLNNEARARAEGQARREVVPFFSIRLRRAREEVMALLPGFDSMAQAQTEAGKALHREMAAFIETTRDVELYSTKGYAEFRAVDARFDEKLNDVNRRQEEVFERSGELERAASRDILLLTGMAFTFGLLTTIGTVYEVQRRFRQVRAALEAARRERQFSTQMLGGMVSAVAAIDGRDCIRSANSAFFEIFPGAAIGASVHDNPGPPEVLKIIETAIASRPTGATYLGRWRVEHTKKEDDDHSAFDLYTSDLTVDDEAGLIITLVDVTEAAKAEGELRQRASLAAVGQAVAQVAHEIKNPIGSIRLGISMLREMAQEEESLTTIALVERGIDHLTKLAQDITQFSRQKPLSRAPVGLHSLLDESLELVADRLNDKQTPLEKHLSDDLVDGIWDEDELRQVFVNLFANAIEASDRGAPLKVITERIDQKLSTSRDGNGHLAFARVTIEDFGAGMDEKTRRRLFEPFFTTKPRGTGLGLAIVKKIIDQHDGHISVKSAPGEGTRFSVELPLPN
ncbi:MAG: ATP-binding protein [Pyrinomonadaceae bacterium]